MKYIVAPYEGGRNCLYFIHDWLFSSTWPSALSLLSRCTTCASLENQKGQTRSPLVCTHPEHAPDAEFLIVLRLAQSSPKTQIFCCMVHPCCTNSPGYNSSLLVLSFAGRLIRLLSLWVSSFVFRRTGEALQYDFTFQSSSSEEADKLKEECSKSVFLKQLMNLEARQRLQVWAY